MQYVTWSDLLALLLLFTTVCNVALGLFAYITHDKKK